MSDYGPESSRSYFYDLMVRQWHTPHGEPLISLSDALIASARSAYTHGHIGLEEFERRVAEAVEVPIPDDPYYVGD